MRRQKTTAFAETLKKLCQERNIKQSDLSRLTGIGKSTMSRYFSGRILPSDEALRAMAQAMDVDPETLRDARDVPCPVNRPTDPGTEYRFAMDAVLRHGKSWTTEQAAGLALAILDQADDPHAVLRKLTNEFGPDASGHSSYSLSSEGAVTDGTGRPSEGSSLK